jgi:hypothetical protein
MIIQIHFFDIIIIFSITLKLLMVLMIQFFVMMI